MNVGFLVTNAYQLHHYERIAAGLSPSTAVVEVREQDFGVDEELVKRHLPGWDVEWVPQRRLASIDGKLDAIVCQSPILPMTFLSKTLVVAEQYSLAKETYQYGIWRAQADLNLMYGPYSVDQVRGFCTAEATGNPLLDVAAPDGQLPAAPMGNAVPSTILYLPTYGDLGAFEEVSARLGELDAEVVVKLHHMDAPARSERLPDNVRVVGSDRHPIELIRAADLVISDYSGAAYDAAFCRVPILLTGEPATGSPDLVRLSSNDVGRAHLLPLASEWHLGAPFQDAFEEATARARDDDAYAEYVERFFTNPGAAGSACAAAIERLVSSGRRVHPVGDRVRETVRRHVTKNRELREENRDLRSRLRKVRARKRGLRATLREVRVLRILYRRAKRVTGEPVATGPRDPSPVTTVTPVDSRPEPLPTPRHLRSEAAAALARKLEGRDVRVATSDDVRAGTLAIEARHRRELLRAVKELASDEPGLRVVSVRGASSATEMPAAALTLEDLFDGPRLDVGVPFRHREYRVGRNGYATVLLVEFDERTQRYLCLASRIEKPDWTSHFQPELLRIEIDEPGRQEGPATDAAPEADPIDLVYTWVDSSDPAWREKHARASGSAVTTLLSANNPERYADREELRYSLRSVELFAPFVRNIYIVTDDQTPPWLDTSNERVRVVDHREIFPDPAVLPVFNSHAIEASLHRIPGLAERYLYLNDDFLLGDEVGPDDFFTSAGLVKAHLSPSQFVYDGQPHDGAIPTDWASYHVRRIIEGEFGVPVHSRAKHIPYPQLRSVLEEIDERYAEQLAATRAARFRSNSDLAIPSMFSLYYSVATHRGVEWPNMPREYVYADTGRADWHARVDRILDWRPKFICLNATRHEDIPLDVQYKNVVQFLSDFLPYRSSFEREDAPVQSATSTR